PKYFGVCAEPGEEPAALVATESRGAPCVGLRPANWLRSEGHLPGGRDAVHAAANCRHLCPPAWGRHREQDRARRRIRFHAGYRPRRDPAESERRILPDRGPARTARAHCEI